MQLVGVGEGQLGRACRRESSGHGSANLGYSSAPFPPGARPPWLSSHFSSVLAVPFFSA